MNNTARIEIDYDEWKGMKNAIHTFEIKYNELSAENEKLKKGLLNCRSILEYVSDIPFIDRTIKWNKTKKTIKNSVNRIKSYGKN